MNIGENRKSGRGMNGFSEELNEFVEKNYKGVSSGMDVLVGKGSYKTSYFTGEIKELNFKYTEDEIVKGKQECY